MKELELPVVIWKENDHYVAYVSPLGVTSQGKTLEETLKNIKEATELYLEDVDEEELHRLENREIYVTFLRITK